MPTPNLPEGVSLILSLKDVFLVPNVNAALYCPMKTADILAVPCLPIEIGSPFESVPSCSPAWKCMPVKIPEVLPPN